MRIIILKKKIKRLKKKQKNIKKKEKKLIMKIKKNNYKSIKIMNKIKNI